jgi:DNA-binding MarR family transcriptional regulator
MLSARHLNRRKKTRGEAPTGVALEMMRAIAGGVTSATLLAEKFKVTKQRISYLLNGLIKAGWLRKNGKAYASRRKPKSQRLKPSHQSPANPLQ